MVYKRLFLLTLLTFLDESEGARILASIFSPSFSHNVVFRPLWRDLANRGHELVLLTTDPMRDASLKNLREIDLGGSYGIMEEYKASELLSRGFNESFFRRVVRYLDALDHTAEWQLERPEVKALIQNSSEQFDLVMVEVMNPIQMAFAERFKVPFIGITPLDAPYRVHAALGNYMHPSVFPDYFYPFIPPLNFLQRVISVVLNWGNWYLQYYTRYPLENLIVKRHFGEGIRDLEELEKDMSLLFMYANPIFSLIRPLGHNTILVGGGAHVQKAKPLPQDLLDYVESAENGIIYFSLGTNVKSALITDTLKKVILSTLAELPYKILWKFEDDTLEGLPENVKIMKWVPQQDVLGHPNVKLFITQCGLMSIEEAIFNDVPMVGMSFMGDQHGNAKILERKQLGLSVDRQTVTSDVFTKAILEVIRNPIYKENVKKISRLTRDVDKTGLERAVWWTEYVIRNKGADHLKSPVADTPAYQFYLLDVYGVLIAIAFVIVYAVILVLKLLIRLLFGKKKEEKKGSKKNKNE